MRSSPRRDCGAGSAASSTMSTNVELDYRDLLSEGNEYNFHREYTVCLDKNLQLR